ncbi:est1 DNA/RNA binding domain-containing protein [Phthorimaea operculella]|nr:est1 DNA/RNA binding domain-containing protein [Phthorimaea operculella]
MVLNAAVQMLREADELKQKILKFKSGTSMLQERSLWATQQQLQKVYQKVLILDLDYALDKKVEQDLWNIGFKHQIEALQAIAKDRKNPLRSEGQAMLSWVLQAAAGFYLCLLHQICTTFKLDLPFRRRASLLGWVEGWGASGAPGGGRAPGSAATAPAAARYICQHCLVHLGDLARYRHQPSQAHTFYSTASCTWATWRATGTSPAKRTPSTGSYNMVLQHCLVHLGDLARYRHQPSQAHTFYRHALVVSADSGQPYNQLALVAWRRGRRLGAIYWHVRSLMVKIPFPPAPANLARTLQAAASAGRDAKDLPVLPGVTSQGTTTPATPATPATRLDAHNYVTELIRAMHLLHTVEQLDTAATLVNNLNSSLTALIATESFESMTLIKMTVVIIWLVHSLTEGLTVSHAALSDSEAQAAALAESLAAHAVLSICLSVYTLPSPPLSALPALKVWLQWIVLNSRLVVGSAWLARPQLWPALAHTLNKLANNAQEFNTNKYESVPLPEDEELHGFLPLEEAFKKLKFPNHASWDTYGGRVPEVDNDNDNEYVSTHSVISVTLPEDEALHSRSSSSPTTPPGTPTEAGCLKLTTTMIMTGLLLLHLMVYISLAGLLLVDLVVYMEYSKPSMSFHQQKRPIKQNNFCFGVISVSPIV